MTRTSHQRSSSSPVRRRSPCGLAAGALAALAAAISGCSLSPALDQCHIIGGSAQWRGGVYTAVLLIKNAAPAPLDIEDLRFEMTTYDAGDRVLEADYPISVPSEIPIERFDTKTIRLDKIDREGRIRRSHVELVGPRGQIISQWWLDAEPRIEAARPPPSFPGATHALPAVPASIWW